MKAQVMHVAVVLARDVMNALQKASPEADRAGQVHSSPFPDEEGNMGRATKSLRTYIGQKDFPPVRINFLNREHQS